MSLPFRCEAVDTPSFEDFRQAMAGLMDSACCGCGMMATPSLDLAREASKPTAFTRLGFDAWRATVRPKRPRLPQITGRYVLPDVTAVSAEGDTAAHQDVTIDNGRIVSVLPSGAQSEGDPAKVLEDCRGAFVSPALADMHTHMPLDNILRLTDLFLLQTLRHGIPAARDAGDADGTSTPAALSAVLSGWLPGPELHYAFAFVTQAPLRWVNSFDYRAPEEAPAIVARLKALGASWVKSYENLDQPRIVALKKAAADAGLGVFGHTPYALTYEEALLPDAQHYMGVPPPASLRRNSVVNRCIDWDGVNQARMDEIRRTCVENSTTMTPTLQLSHAFLWLARHGEAKSNASCKALPSFYADIIWHPKHGVPVYRNLSAEDFDNCRRAIEKRGRLTRALFDDGVALRLGTDTQQPFSAPGVSLHNEFVAFEAAGISRQAAFKLATIDAFRALGINDAGRIEAGARAELMVSRRNPLDQLWDVQHDLQAVVAKGTLVYTDDLDRAIKEELARFEGLFAEYATHWIAKFAMNRLAKNFVA